MEHEDDDFVLDCLKLANLDDNRNDDVLEDSNVEPFIIIQ